MRILLSHMPLETHFATHSESILKDCAQRTAGLLAARPFPKESIFISSERFVLCTIQTSMGSSDDTCQTTGVRLICSPSQSMAIFWKMPASPLQKN